MNCPKCHAAMNTINSPDIVALQCSGCHGIWFREGTHEKARHRTDIDIANTHAAAVYDEVRDITCPECHQKMIRMIDRAQHHIHYESCTYCDGVFFDAGEFSDFTAYSFVERVKEVITTLKINLKHL